MESIDSIFEALGKSDFRRRMKLRRPDQHYLRAKGLDTVMAHAAEFIEARLAPAHPARDGMQTPMKGHPVFVAQHATATCCRRCLASWHKIPAGHPLSEAEQHHILVVLRRWLESEIRRLGSEPEDPGQLKLAL